MQIEIYQVVPSETASLSFPHMLVGRNASPHLVPSPSPSSFHPNTSEGSNSPPRKSPSLGGKIGERGGNEQKGMAPSQNKRLPTLYLCVYFVFYVYSRPRWARGLGRTSWGRRPRSCEGRSCRTHGRPCTTSGCGGKRSTRKNRISHFFHFFTSAFPFVCSGDEKRNTGSPVEFLPFLFSLFWVGFLFKSVRLFAFLLLFHPWAWGPPCPPPSPGKRQNRKREKRKSPETSSVRKCKYAQRRRLSLFGPFQFSRSLFTRGVKGKGDGSHCRCPRLHYIFRIFAIYTKHWRERKKKEHRFLTLASDGGARAEYMGETVDSNSGDRGKSTFSSSWKELWRKKEESLRTWNAWAVILCKARACFWDTAGMNVECVEFALLFLGLSRVCIFRY